MKTRTQAEQFLDRDQALAELDRLKFAVSSLVQLLTTPGSHPREVGENVTKGVKARIDYLHDSFMRLLAQP